MSDIRKQVEIVKQRMSYHFAGTNKKWDVDDMPFMNEFLNEVESLCNIANPLKRSLDSNGVLPLTKEELGELNDIEGSEATKVWIEDGIIWCDENGGGMLTVETYKAIRWLDKLFELGEDC